MKKGRVSADLKNESPLFRNSYNKKNRVDPTLSYKLAYNLQNCVYEYCSKRADSVVDSFSHFFVLNTDSVQYRARSHAPSIQSWNF
jgi:hypothetical protein